MPKAAPKIHVNGVDRPMTEAEYAEHLAQPPLERGAEAPSVVAE